MLPKGRGHPNGHEGSYKKRPRQEKALSRLVARLSCADPGNWPDHPSFDAWLASSQREEAALRKALNQ